MFDFVKTSNQYLDIQKLNLNPLLKFDLEVNSDYEIEKRIAEYQNLKFKITDEKYININGSLHKYFNNGNHNYNDFGIIQLVEVLSDLYIKFDINPFLTPLNNLEFGVNVIIPFKTNSFLNSIISYKGKEYEIERYNGKGYLLRFSFDHYELKIYNKGYQYNQDENILRFEIKVRKMEYFRARNIEIKRLSDLLNPGIYPRLKDCLLKAFSELVIYDSTIRTAQLKKREQTLLTNGRNPKYWAGLVENRKEIKKKRKRFNELVLKYGKQNLKQTVYELIEQKIDLLTSANINTELKINELRAKIDTSTSPNITNLTTAYSVKEIPLYNTSNIELEESPKQRYCLSCNRDITNQKKGSVFCSEKLYGKEAKKCRNIQSNPRNNYLKKEQKLYSGNLLFDISDYKEVLHFTVNNNKKQVSK